MQSRQVAIRAIGPVTPIGTGAEAFATRLKEGRSGLDEITGFDTSDLAIQSAFEVQDFDLADHLDSVKSYVDRTSAFGLAAASMALKDAQWEPSEEQPIGLVLGTEWGCLDSMQLYAEKITKADPKFAQPLLFTQGYMNAPNSLISIEFGLRGFNACFSCGRTSGATAIGYAFDVIRHGRANRLLAGGVDVLSRVLCASQDGKAYGPLGEAAGLLALEPATNNDDAVLILGVGEASGENAGYRAFEAAIAQAAIATNQLDAVILATDPAAVGLLSRVFTAHQPHTHWLDSSAGDSMGASGAVGACAAVLMIQHAIVPNARRVAVFTADLHNSAVLIVGRARG